MRILHYQIGMNRIRQIREKRGLTQAQLADRVGTTQPTIMRLENGKRRLTVEWMRKIAKALDVLPEELLSTAVLAGLQEDARPYQSDDKSISHPALAARGLAHFVITSDALQGAGLQPGTVILIDMTPGALQAMKTGDVIVAQAYDVGGGLTATTIVRQFVAPGLLVTNRQRANVAMSLDDPDYDIAIKGVMVTPQ